MTESVNQAIADAWAANDAAIAGLVAEMNTLAAEVAALPAAGGVPDADVVAAIQQRTTAMQAALQSVQSSLLSLKYCRESSEAEAPTACRLQSLFTAMFADSEK